jgi:DNA-binding CsgD family transcriptional regulator
MTPEDVRRVATCVAAIQGLPGVATTDWCEKAAEVLGLLWTDAPVGIAIGSIGRETGPVRVELSHLSGASAGGRVRRAMEGRGLHRRVRGVLERIGEVETGAIGVRWAPGQVGSPWEDMGILELVTGLGRLDGRRGGRMLVVEIGPQARVPSDSDDEARAAVLGAVMGVLLARCRMAFVPGPVDASRRVTPSEQVILNQLVLGRSVREIAEGLERSPHTVHDHVKSLHRKLRAKSRGELIARALGHLSGEDVLRERANGHEPAHPRVYAAGA